MQEQSNELVNRFSRSLGKLQEAAPYAKSLYQQDVYQEAKRLLKYENGVEQLYQYAHLFDEAGVFLDGPWERAEKLQPPLVAGSLQTKGLTSVVEVLSDLRILAISNGEYEHDVLSANEAEVFLNEVIALNLDLLFPNATESIRIENVENKQVSHQLLQFISSYLSPKALIQTLTKEIERLTAQRPIMVTRTVSMIKMAKEMLNTEASVQNREDLVKLISSIEGPSPLSKKYQDLKAYRVKLKDAKVKELRSECVSLASSMRETGLVSSHHAILLRFLIRRYPQLVPTALRLSDKGLANFEEHYDLITQIIKVAVYPATRQSIYGLACMLERGVLSSSPVIPGLKRLIELDIRPEVREELIHSVKGSDGLTANTILLSGVLSVLGQPLGVGQGLNPTCQSARGISLWAQHAPGYLLELIPRAARDGDIDFRFEGTEIHSKHLSGGLAPELHTELDPVSLVLVPHLDKIYNEMMKKVVLRGEDGHRWVNPAFYGNWVQTGFSTVINPLTGSVSDHSGFVRLFYATHHPAYNDDYELIYPNPVGIFITNVHGKLLGFHAVSILRVAKDPSGDMRVYFYNPNNDSSQNWGQGIIPTVMNNGEREGECSLKFHEFASRLYAFHYNPYEQGEAFAVEQEEVNKVTELAQSSWGNDYAWVSYKL